MKEAYLMKTEDNRNENYAKLRFKVHIYKKSFILNYLSRENYNLIIL